MTVGAQKMQRRIRVKCALVFIPALSLLISCRSMRGLDTRDSIVKDVMSWRVHAGFNEDVSKPQYEYEEVDLTGKCTRQVVVTVSDGDSDFAEFYLYTVRRGKPDFLGKLEGFAWWPLSSKSNGFWDIETGERMGWDKEVLRRYSFVDGKYTLVTHALYRWDDNWGTGPLLRTFK